MAMIISAGIVFGYMSAPGVEEIGVGLIDDVIIIKDDLKSFEDFDLDFSIFDNESYKSLEIFGENPVDPGITGERKNPFAPL